MPRSCGAGKPGRTAVDGFGMEAPDSKENAAYFGYAGKKERCSFPYVQMAALAECGTHAIVARSHRTEGRGRGNPDDLTSAHVRA